jgi:hypothetical protein
MTWTFRGLQNLDLALERYETELSERLDQADSDSSAQKILNEIRAWRKFNEAVKDLESTGDDPSNVLPVVRENGVKLPPFYRFSEGPFNLIYLRDPVTMTATPMLIYHQRDRPRRLREALKLPGTQ